METEATVSEFQDMLSARGVTRRSFMKLCGAVAAAAGLSQLAAPQIAQALEKSVIGATKGKLYPVIWIEGASCMGCTESFAQVETPDPASVVLELISLNYSETLSARIDAEVHALIERGRSQAEEVLTGNWDKLEKLVAALLDREKIDGNEFKILMEGGTLEPVSQPEELRQPEEAKPEETGSAPTGEETQEK